MRKQWIVPLLFYFPKSMKIRSNQGCNYAIIDEVSDAVGSFQAIASEIGIDKPVSSVILSHIKSRS